MLTEAFCRPKQELYKIFTIKIHNDRLINFGSEYRKFMSQVDGHLFIYSL